jgi:Xaa-Pro aminopeptidase
MPEEVLTNLRHEMKKNNLAAYIIPSTDPHASEYLPACWQRRAYLSNFTGSAGELIVTLERAALWTDSRYWLQAEQQMKALPISLMRQGSSGIPTPGSWLQEQLQGDDRVGIDPQLIQYQAFADLEAELDSAGIKLVSIRENLVDKQWQSQPPLPRGRATLQPLAYAGARVGDKINDLRAATRAARADAHVISALDQIAWLFNLRGSDIDYNPYLIAYGIVTQDEVKLYVHKEKLSPQLLRELQQSDVQIAGYADFFADLKQYSENLRLFVDSVSASKAIAENLAGQKQHLFANSPIWLRKACKNEVELAGSRNAHRRDGVAMVRFLYWLENSMANAAAINEYEIGEKLDQFRKEQSHYMGPSFAPIVGFGANAAIVHYSAKQGNSAVLQPDGFLLVDSGGQYRDGTTDITRTIPLGPTNNEQRERYTQVLQGHIALAQVRFPKGTTGPALDTLARLPLWQVGENYGHGTGHGIGSFLSVHEGPQGISYYRGHGVALEPGMICSNEPGFYKEGEYGIRIENIIVVKAADKRNFLSFDTISLCPIETIPIVNEMLSRQEREWLNDYHNLVWQEIGPLLDKEEAIWLKQKTRAI